MPGDVAMPRPTDAVFHGLPTLRLSNGAVWIEALAIAGPRIVGLGLGDDGPNILAETPDITWDTPRGTYRLVGGHRLWLAPEDPAVSAAPDGDGLVAASPGDGVLRLTGAPEPGTGVVRTVEIRLDPAGTALGVRHTVRNGGGRPLEVAAWAITQLPPGGLAIVPQPAAVDGHETRPNRILVLWPYASVEDPRIALRDGYLAVEGTSGPDLKVGCRADEGWIAWARDGVALVRRFEPVPAARHPDLGANAEVFVGARYLELEVLGPLRHLEPGEAVTLDERWELRAVPAGASPAQLRQALRVPVPAVADPASPGTLSGSGSPPAPPQIDRTPAAAWPTEA
jgi:hypothetical protein